MKAFYSWEGLFGGTHNEELMERSTLNEKKNFVRREWICEPKESLVKGHIKVLWGRVK